MNALNRSGPATSYDKYAVPVLDLDSLHAARATASPDHEAKDENSEPVAKVLSSTSWFDGIDQALQHMLGFDCTTCDCRMDCATERAHTHVRNDKQAYRTERRGFKRTTDQQTVEGTNANHQGSRSGNAAAIKARDRLSSYRAEELLQAGSSGLVGPGVQMNEGELPHKPSPRSRLSQMKKERVLPRPSPLVGPGPQVREDHVSPRMKEDLASPRLGVDSPRGRALHGGEHGLPSPRGRLSVTFKQEEIATTCGEHRSDQENKGDTKNGGSKGNDDAPNSRRRSTKSTKTKMISPRNNDKPSTKQIASQRSPRTLSDREYFQQHAAHLEQEQQRRDRFIQELVKEPDEAELVIICVLSKDSFILVPSLPRELSQLSRDLAHNACGCAQDRVMGFYQVRSLQNFQKRNEYLQDKREGRI